VRNNFADAFYQAAREDERLCMVVADISPAGAMDKFRTEFPKRFVNTGVAEQIMIGLCSGMALRGLRPFAYTIATFALFRPFEFVRDDLCYHNLPVTVVGIGGGVTYSTLGGTHHAQEDVALATAIPNMAVLAPCDPAETRAAARWLVSDERYRRGPVYLRLGKAGEPALTASAEPFVFGRLRRLKPGDDVCIMGYGPALKLAFDLAARFDAVGKSAAVVSCHTLKPLDSDGIVDMLKRYRHVVVLEEMAPSGGLGPRVKALAWDAGARCRLDTFALQDAFIHCYGSHGELLAAHGFDLATLAKRLGLD
jgi:transketolase